MTEPLRLLLGPQRPLVNLNTELDSLNIGDEPIAVISAAWQEAEGDIDDVRHLVSNPLSDLGIYKRAAELFAADKALHDAYRQRQERLQEQQRLYRIRLRQLMIAARRTLRADGNPSVIAAERRHAIAQLRELDRHHLRQIKKSHTRFDSAYNIDCHALLAEHTAAVADDLSKVSTVMIAGGNVVVLMNRLTLFGMTLPLQQKNIVGWSAGAMVLGERVVLFHDRLPQGRRDSEILCEGLGMLPGVIVLPDAQGRLRTKERIRTSLFSRRFSPAACVTLDNGASMLFDGAKLRESTAAKRMTRGGNFRRLRPA
jgi:hypothetical protein